MATIIADKSGYVSGAARCVYPGRGVLIALVISHSESTTQTVNLYDNNDTSGNVLLAIKVAAGQTPYYLEFPARYPMVFYTGLTVDPGLCQVQVIAEGI
jgi:hypothetical protein